MTINKHIYINGIKFRYTNFYKESNLLQIWCDSNDYYIIRGLFDSRTKCEILGDEYIIEKIVTSQSESPHIVDVDIYLFTL